MTPEFSKFAARLREFIALHSSPQPFGVYASAGASSLPPEGWTPNEEATDGGARVVINSQRGAGRTRCGFGTNRAPASGGDGAPSASDADFNDLALELFALQFAHNPPYRRVCEARGVSPETVSDWSRIPVMPTAAFKELELSCVPVGERMAVFHSSGTTGQTPSRHFHSAESLAIYEASLLPWFRTHLLAGLECRSGNLTDEKGETPFPPGFRLVILTPPPVQAPQSSLVYMFETARREFGPANSRFFGRTDAGGGWHLDLQAVSRALRKACDSACPVVLLGTAFAFVHLLDHLADSNLEFKLPPGSRVMETGGYKNKSRELSKTGLHTFISQRLGVRPSHIVCEYGMTELGSQAYDCVAGERKESGASRAFHFPPWARAQIVSPETGREVAEGETGLIRVFDLANVFSVLAIQTKDLGVRCGEGFELLGRAVRAEPRGCSLMVSDGRA